MDGIRTRIDCWGRTTYSDALNERIQKGVYNNGPELDLTMSVLRRQGLWNSEMSGYSTNRLETMEREVGTFRYVSVFNIMSQLKDYSPVDMIYGVCYLAKNDQQLSKDISRCARKWHMSEDDLITKMCGRALRAMPSYIREHDMKDQIEQRFKGASFRQDELVDTTLHADLVMTHNGEQYYFWSFVGTGKSLENFQDKLMGNRHGIVPDGTHVICPFNLNFCDQVCGWKLYDAQEIHSIVSMIQKGTAIDYDQVARMTDRNRHYFKEPRMVVKATVEISPAYAYTDREI